MRKNPSNPPRERHEDQPASLRYNSVVGMRCAARQKDQAAWPNLELLVAALVDALVFDHVVHLVLITMHVPWGVQQRRALLEDRERTACHIRRRPDDDRRPAEDKTLAPARPSSEGTRPYDHPLTGTHAATGDTDRGGTQRNSG
jgi:hypothetical protein